MLSLPASSRVFSLLLASALVSACGTDEDPIGDPQSDDDPEPDPDPEAQIACEEQVIVLEGLDAASPEGPSAGDVLDPVIGDYLTKMAWVAQEGPVKVDVTPLAAEVQLMLDIAYEGGELRYVASAPNDAAMAAGAELDCRSRLELDVVLSLESDDGALADHLPVVLQAEIVDGVAGSAQVHQALDLEALDGSLAIASIEPAEPDDLALTLDASFDFDEDALMMDPNGQIGGWAEYREGEGEDAVVTHSEFVLATW